MSLTKTLPIFGSMKTIARFLSRCCPSFNASDCIDYLGAPELAGRPVIGVRVESYGDFGPAAGPTMGRRMFAHQFAWRLARGGVEIPDNLEIHHTCENVYCVNPVHLVACTKSGHKAIHDRMREGGRS